MKGLGMIVGIFDSIVEGTLRRIALRGRSGETFVNRRLMQHYGFASSPLEDCEVLALEEGGSVVIVAEDDRRYRIELAAGEVAISTDEGDKIHFQRGKKIAIVSGGEVTATAPIITLTDCDELNLGGVRAELKRLVDERIETWLNAHTHTSATAGNPTSPPIAPLVITTVSTDIARAQ